MVYDCTYGNAAGGYSLRPDTDNPANFGKMERPANYKDLYKTALAYCDSVISSATHTLSLPYYRVFVNECNYVVNSNDDPIFEILLQKKLPVVLVMRMDRRANFMKVLRVAIIFGVKLRVALH